MRTSSHASSHFISDKGDKYCEGREVKFSAACRLKHMADEENKRRTNGSTMLHCTAGHRAIRVFVCVSYACLYLQDQQVREMGERFLGQ